MFNLKLTLFVVVGLVALYLSYLQDSNTQLKAKLQQSKELHYKTVEAYENNKKLDNKLQELQKEVQINKEEVINANTKLKVEIAKRDKEIKKDENTNNSDDFSIITF